MRWLGAILPPLMTFTVVAAGLQALWDSGHVRPIVGQVFPLERGADARPDTRRTAGDERCVVPQIHQAIAITAGTPLSFVGQKLWSFRA